MDITLNAKERDTSTKGVQLRKKGLIPACIFSKDMESFPVQINAVEFNNCVKAGAVKIQIKVGTKLFLASIDEIQKNFLLIKVGNERKAYDILYDQKNNLVSEQKKIQNMSDIVSMVIGLILSRSA